MASDLILGRRGFLGGLLATTALARAPEIAWPITTSAAPMPRGELGRFEGFRFVETGYEIIGGTVNPFERFADLMWLKAKEPEADGHYSMVIEPSYFRRLRDGPFTLE